MLTMIKYEKECFILYIQNTLFSIFKILNNKTEIPGKENPRACQETSGAGLQPPILFAGEDSWTIRGWWNSRGEKSGRQIRKDKYCMIPLI